MAERLWGRLKPEARRMRRKPTVTEDLLWQRLRAAKIVGARFRRQHAIDPFIVDFYCARARVVVEVDGEIHDRTKDQDAVRQDNLERRGMRVLRFRAQEVKEKLDRVVASIRDVVLSRLQSSRGPSPDLLERGA